MRSGSNVFSFHFERRKQAILQVTTIYFLRFGLPTPKAAKHSIYFNSVQSLLSETKPNRAAHIHTHTERLNEWQKKQCKKEIDDDRKTKLIAYFAAVVICSLLFLALG